MVCGMLALTSCEKYDDLVPSEYHHILNIKQYGMQRISLYTTGDDAVYKFTVMKGGSEAGNTASATVEVMSEEEYKAYAADNNVNEAYLPADMYTIPETSLSFASSETYKIVDVILKTSDIKKMMNESQKSFALPIRIKSKDCNVKNDILIIQPNIETPTIGFDLAGGNQFLMGSTFTEEVTATVNVEFNVTFPTNNQWEFSFDAKTDEKAEKVFVEYNKQHENKYTRLPQEAYQFKGNGISFPLNSSTMTLSVSIDPSKMSCGEYILPLHLSNLSNKHFEVDEDNGVILLGVKYIPNKLNLTVDQLKTNSVEVGDGSGLAGLIDGDTTGGGYFHSKWSSPVMDATYGNYVDVDFRKELHSLSFDYWTRFQNGNGAPRRIKLFTSKDGKTWKEWKEINKGLPGGSHQKYSSSIFTHEEGFTHIRFAVIESAAGNLTTTAKYFNLHELTFFGK